MSTSAATARLEARLSWEIHALLKQAAELQGRTLTDFVVSAAHEAAQRTIAEAALIRLSVADQARFADALLAPPLPTPTLQRAFDHRRRLFNSE